jgi:hypothetical protein
MFVGSAILLAACAEEELPPVECLDSGRYLALETGKSWTYRIDDRNDKTQTVGALETMDGAKAGVTAYRMTTEKLGGEVISWQEDDGVSIVRHREMDMAGTIFTDEYYAPSKPRFDGSPEHTALGATWTATYTETITEGTMPPIVVDKTETSEIVSVDETIEVPAGRFCTMRVHRTATVNGNPGSDKTFWYARGIGKIKEIGGNQLEELVSFEP